MVNQRTMFLCPACSCHARRCERACPHCGAPLEREAGGEVQRSLAAIAMGLAVAVALPLVGCGDDTGGGGGGGSGGAGNGGGGASASSAGDDASSSSGDNLAASTYGVASSVNVSTGTAGGEGGSF